MCVCIYTHHFKVNPRAMVFVTSGSAVGQGCDDLGDHKTMVHYMLKNAVLIIGFLVAVGKDSAMVCQQGAVPCLTLTHLHPKPTRQLIFF